MKLLILDGNSVINRAYFGVKPLTTREGLYTHAIYGFLNILERMEKEEQPEAICVAFDLHGPTFRHLKYDGYKATRHGMPEELDELNDKKSERVAFVEAIRRFIRMETITAPLLHELVDRIEVYETEGTGKNKTQRIVIYYRFVGNIEIPSDEENLKLDMRQGMAVEYLTA